MSNLTTPAHVSLQHDAPSFQLLIAPTCESRGDKHMDNYMLAKDGARPTCLFSHLISQFTPSCRCIAIERFGIAHVQLLQVHVFRTTRSDIILLRRGKGQARMDVKRI
jgi:hypothetical protein